MNIRNKHKIGNNKIIIYLSLYKYNKLYILYIKINKKNNKKVFYGTFKFI